MNDSMNFSETTKAIEYLFKTNLVPLLLGHTGIGKTQLVEQYARKRDQDLIVIHVAQLEPSDFVGLYKITEDGRTANCPPNWLPYKEFDKTKAKEGLAQFLHGGAINPNGGIVFLDEINRGHEDIRQAMYQFITAKKIHTYTLPPNYKIVAAANPTNSYECYEFDPALINRFAWIKFCPDCDETIKYLEAKYNKKTPITQWLATDKSLIDYGSDDFNITDLRSTPRICDEAISIYEAMIDERKDFQRKMLETVMPKEKVSSFLAFLDEIKFLNYKDVLKGLKEAKKEKLTALIKSERRDVLSTLTMDLGDVFSKTIDQIKVDGVDTPVEKMIQNLCDFLEVIPEELCTAFIDKIPQEMYSNPKCVLNDKKFRETLKPRLGKYAKLFKK